MPNPQSQFDEEIGLLRRAVAVPVQQLIAAEVESPAQAREIFAELQALNPTRPAALIDFDSQLQTAHALLTKARAEAERLRHPGTFPLLGLRDISENPSHPGDPAARQFWTLMNLLREAWGAIEAQTTFFLQPLDYYWLTHAADHLASWIPVKVHLLRPGPLLRDGKALSQRTYLQNPDRNAARQDLAALLEKLSAAKEKSSPDNGWVRQIYLPLFEAALDAGDIKTASQVRREAAGLSILRPDQPKWLELNAELDAMQSDWMGAEEFANQLADLGARSSDKRLQARGLKLGADALWRRGEYSRAIQSFNDALTFYRGARDVAGEANCLGSLADIALERSDLESARQRYEEARSLFRSIRHTLGEANCVAGLAEIALRRSEFQSAAQHFEEALTLYRQANDILGEANCVRSFGEIALARSDYEKAEELFDKALTLYRAVDEVFGEANCLVSLGKVALRRSRHERASQLFEEALLLYRRLRSVLGQANCLVKLGELAKPVNLGTAHERFAQALALYETIPDPVSIAMTHLQLARLATSVTEREKHLAAAIDASKGPGGQSLMNEISAMRNRDALFFEEGRSESR